MSVPICGFQWIQNARLCTCTIPKSIQPHPPIHEEWLYAGVWSGNALTPDELRATTRYDLSVMSPRNAEALCCHDLLMNRGYCTVPKAVGWHDAHCIGRTWGAWSWNDPTTAAHSWANECLRPMYGKSQCCCSLSPSKQNMCTVPLAFGWHPRCADSGDLGYTPRDAGRTSAMWTNPNPISYYEPKVEVVSKSMPSPVFESNPELTDYDLLEDAHIDLPTLEELYKSGKLR